MAILNSFKYCDNKLNEKFISLLNISKIKHAIDRHGAVLYSSRYEAVVEGTILSSIRSKLFSAWQIIGCPADWAGRYRTYMARRAVPFVEEVIDGQLCFLISRQYRPHSWKLDLPVVTEESPSKRACRAETPIGGCPAGVVPRVQNRRSNRSRSK